MFEKGNSIEAAYKFFMITAIACIGLFPLVTPAYARDPVPTETPTSIATPHPSERPPKDLYITYSEPYFMDGIEVKFQYMRQSKQIVLSEQQEEIFFEVIKQGHEYLKELGIYADGSIRTMLYVILPDIPDQEGHLTYMKTVRYSEDRNGGSAKCMVFIDAHTLYPAFFQEYPVSPEDGANRKYADALSGLAAHEQWHCDKDHKHKGLRFSQEELAQQKLGVVDFDRVYRPLIGKELPENRALK